MADPLVLRSARTPPVTCAGHKRRPTNGNPAHNGRRSEGAVVGRNRNRYRIRIRRLYFGKNHFLPQLLSVLCGHRCPWLSLLSQGRSVAVSPLGFCSLDTGHERPQDYCLLVVAKSVPVCLCDDGHGGRGGAGSDCPIDFWIMGQCRPHAVTP